MHVSCIVARISGAFPELPCIRLREIGVGFRHQRDPRRRGNGGVRALVVGLTGCRGAFEAHRECMFRAKLHAFPVHFRGSHASVGAKLGSVSDIDGIPARAGMTEFDRWRPVL